MATTGWGPAAGSPGGTIVKSGYGIAGAASPGPDPEPEPLNPDADIRRLVTIDSTGTVTELLTLETADTLLSVKDSFTVKPAERKGAEAGSGRRYQGTRTVNESHGNASVAWKVLVKGPEAPDVASNIEALIAEFEGLLHQPNVYLEWVPVGHNRSTYYEVRGVAKWQPTYKWAEFFGTRGMYCDLEVPVAPLARGATDTQDLGSFTAPCVVSLPDAVGGTAPAAANITVSKASGANNPAFGLLAWWKQLPAAPSGYVQCFGVIEAETGGSLNDFASASNAIYHGGAALRVAAVESASSPASARYKICTAGITGRTVDVEVWARVLQDSSVLSPRLIVSATSGETTGASIYTNEFGQTGAPITELSGSAFTIRKLGTLTLPVAGVSDRWALDVQLTWGGGSTGVFALDWLALVPAQSRAVSPTGEPLDSAYPRFMPSGTGAATKIVRSDLTGVLMSSSYVAADSSMGGSLIELPPGDVDLLVIASAMVPDGEGSDAKEIALSGGVEIHERHYLLAS